jgi:hypothetical protein
LAHLLLRLRRVFNFEFRHDNQQPLLLEKIIYMTTRNKHSSGLRRNGSGLLRKDQCYIFVEFEDIGFIPKTRLIEDIESVVTDCKQRRTKGLT